jgi:hypothetical protein
VGLVTSAANWQIGLAKQTNESTIPTIAAYEYPVFSGRPQPVQDIDRVQVTDNAAIIGDPYKKSGEHWESSVEHPAFADLLGLELVSLWPLDTKTGAGPTYTHTYSTLGTTQAWFAQYSTAPGPLAETFEAGICTGMAFVVTEEGGPLHITHKMVGKKPTVAAHTITTSPSLADGYFTATGAVLKFEEDNATPVQQTNIQKATITVDRNAEALATADGVSVAFLSQGRVEPNFTMTLLYATWDAYRATFYGSAAGTAPSATIVKGSVELNYVHSVQAGWSLKLTIPSAVMAASPPQPDASGSPLAVEIHGYATKPGSGDHVQPVLINAVSSAY